MRRCDFVSFQRKLYRARRPRSRTALEPILPSAFGRFRIGSRAASMSRELAAVPMTVSPHARVRTRIIRPDAHASFVATNASARLHFVLPRFSVTVGGVRLPRNFFLASTVRPSPIEIATCAELGLPALMLLAGIEVAATSQVRPAIINSRIRSLLSQRVTRARASSVSGVLCQYWAS
jgi:hypothetical protein